MAARSVAAIAMGSPEVRTSSVASRDGFWATGSNIWAAGSSSSPCRRTSPTTPTTVNQGPSAEVTPILNRLPTESCPGHSRRAIVSLTIAALGAFGPSSEENARPRTSGIRSVSNRPPLTSSRRSRNRSAPRALPSTVTLCSGLALMKRSPMTPAPSTPRVLTTRSKTCW